MASLYTVLPTSLAASASAGRGVGRTTGAMRGGLRVVVLLYRMDEPLTWRIAGAEFALHGQTTGTLH